MTHIPIPCTEPQTLLPHYTSALVTTQLSFTPAPTPSLSRYPKHTTSTSAHSQPPQPIPHRWLPSSWSRPHTHDPYTPGLVTLALLLPPMTRPLPQLPLSLPSPPSVPPPTPTPAPAGCPQAFHLVHELPALLHHLLVHCPGRVGAEVVVVVVMVRLEGVLHEPDQAARAPGAAAASRPRALFHVASHSPRTVGGPAAYAGSTPLLARERRA